MKKISSPLFWGTMVIAITTLFFACKKDSSSDIPNGQNKLSVYLTDAPTVFQEVWVDIKGIAVKVDTCSTNSTPNNHPHPGCDHDHDSVSNHCEIWDTLNINPGVYDLLTLSNGVNTLLASGFLLNGKIERIKITLGDSNSVVLDTLTNVHYPLHLWHNQHYAYIDIRREHLDSLSSNNLQLYLDFDLAHSIFRVNGQYWLSPVLRPFGQHSTGQIAGRIRPYNSYGMVKAFNSTDSGFAMPSYRHHGEFKIVGLNPGTYSVFIDGVNGYNDTTINNVVVDRNRETQVGNIQLHQ